MVWGLGVGYGVCLESEEKIQVVGVGSIERMRVSKLRLQF